MYLLYNMNFSLYIHRVQIFDADFFITHFTDSYTQNWLYPTWSRAAGVKNAEIQAAPMHANRTAVQANVGANLYIPSTVNTQMNLVLLHFFGPLVKISVDCRIRIKMRKLLSILFSTCTFEGQNRLKYTKLVSCARA